VILLSAAYEIVAVLRTFRPHVPEGGDASRFQVYEVGAKYTAFERTISEPPRTFAPMTRERLAAMLKDTHAAPEEEEEEINALLPQGEDVAGKKKRGKKKKEVKFTLRKALVNGAADYGAQLVEEVIRSSGLDGNKLVHQIGPEGTVPIGSGG
jgi:hypothetical protein